jgi:hypothetical protein
MATLEAVNAEEHCPSGACGGAVPPVIGSILTGTGLTVAAAVAALERGEHVELTELQRRIVLRWAFEAPHQ